MSSIVFIHLHFAATFKAYQAFAAIVHISISYMRESLIAETFRVERGGIKMSTWISLLQHAYWTEAFKSGGGLRVDNWSNMLVVSEELVSGEGMDSHGREDDHCSVSR